MSSKKDISRKLTPGMPGTKKMLDIYGDDLVCVRYRYDVEKRIKYKTVEIIIDEGIWDTGARRLRGNRKVQIKVMYEEINLRKKVKDAGGIWNREESVWELDYKNVEGLGLKERIVKTGNKFLI